MRTYIGLISVLKATVSATRPLCFFFFFHIYSTHCQTETPHREHFLHVPRITKRHPKSLCFSFFFFSIKIQKARLVAFSDSEERDGTNHCHIPHQLLCSHPIDALHLRYISLTARVSSFKISSYFFFLYSKVN